MRELKAGEISDAVSLLCQEGNFFLPEDVKSSLLKAKERERSHLGIKVIESLIENSRIAEEKRMPLCQDTGFAVFYVELGQEIAITGNSLEAAIDEGVRMGYTKGYLRASMVAKPCGFRENTGDNTPAIVHLRNVPGSKFKVTFAPKGGGSENSVRLKMMTPNDCFDQVEKFAVDCVLEIGARACPPLVVGVGIGGNAEEAVLTAKEAAALRPLGSAAEAPHLSKLESKILSSINATGIGPQGLGGMVTALAVHIKEKPTHIATLPVAVNLQCHSLRRRTVTI